MTKSVNQIMDLKFFIDKISPAIEEQKQIVESNTNFGEHFVASFNELSLKQLEKELQEQQQREFCDIFEYRLMGKEISYGSIPAEILGSFLNNLQKVVSRIAQSIATEVPSSVISNDIEDATRLNVQAFAPGSFKIICSSFRPDVGVFNGLPPINEENLTFKANQKLFDLLESISEQDSLLNEVEDLNPYAISAIADLFKTLKKSEIDVEATWQGLNHKSTKYIENKNIVKAYDMFSNFETTPKEIEETFKGNVIAINVEKSYLEFKDENSIKIKVDFDKKALDVLKDKGVNPLFDKLFKLSIVKLTYTTPSGKTREINNFITIEPVE